jgi:hypothetical protein
VHHEDPGRDHPKLLVRHRRPARKRSNVGP